MMLTEAQVRRFREQGYLVVPDFFEAREVEAIRAEVDRFKRVGLLRNVATDGDGVTHSKTVANLQLCPMHPHSTLFRALPFKPKVIEAVTQLIGPEVILHLDQVFLKPGKHGMGTNWHQDNAYFKIHDPLQGTAMWIAVHDATLANGTMQIIPNMFNALLPHDRDPHSDHHIRCYPDESKAVPCEIKAGSVVFFCYGTPHCTKANTTDKERAGVAYHFLTYEAASGPAQQNTFTENRNNKPYLTGPKASGGEGEYGTKIAGTWEDEIDKTLAASANV